jgi:outer membrane murein-binding lipoprotein Lpp
MNPRALVLAVVAGALLTAGCAADNNARAYAKNLGAVLKAYQEQVNQKVKAEQDSYKRLAGVYGRAQDENARESLWLERSELSEQTADQLRGGKSPSISEIRALLKKYADTDIELMRKLLEREGTDNTESLAALASLDVETKKVESLGKALDTLAEPRSTRQQLKELAAFAGQVDTEFKKLVCADLAQQLKTAQDQKKEAEEEAKKPGLSEAQKTAADAKVKRLEALVSDLEKRKTSNKCA